MQSTSVQNLTILASAVPEISIGASKLKSGTRDPDYAAFKDDLSSLCWDLTQHTCMQNLTSLASAILEIWLVPTH